MTAIDGDRDVDAAGLTAIGPYSVRRFIAEGGFAWVYEVADPKFPMRRLALKMLKPAAARGDEFRRFESEARLIASFDHPNLVTVFDFGRDEHLGCNYYTMNFVAGPTLSAMGRLSIEDAAPIIAAALAGLTQLHDAHIVHRDIKPANILTTADGRAMLADLGIARDQMSSQAITKLGLTIGTPRYMSPEQARGVRVEPASDVFSMGVVLYEVLTGHGIYDKDATDNEILMSIGARVHSGAEIEFAFPRNVPAPIQEVVRKACRTAPGDRYPTAREMREALQRVVGEVGARARIQPWQIAAGVGAIAVLAAGVWAGSALWTRRAARALDGQAAAAAQLAKSVLESVAAEQPPPDIAMLSGSQQQLDTAEVTRENGRHELAQARYEDAAIYLRLAMQGFESTCERLTHEHFEPQLQAVRDDLDKRSKELEGLGAASLTPAEWQEFETKHAALATGVDATGACERSDAMRLRMADAGAVLAVATSVLAKLGTILPDLARVARRDAEAARNEAIRNASDSQLYRAVFERGERAFAEGRAKAEAGSHVEARDALSDSAVDFTEAGGIGGALAKRAQVKQAQDRALERRVRDFGLASLVLSRAEEQFAARDWSAAQASYERAVTEIDALVAPAPPPPPPRPENHPPTLALSAESTDLLRVGQKRTFRATTTDPDGDAVDVEFSVDARRTSAGPEFSFAPAKPGHYQIAARATDAQGATASDAIDVEVAANPAPTPPPAPRATPKAKEAPAPAPAPAPPPEVARVPDAAPPPPPPKKLDVVATAAKTLNVYAQAYEARDVERLRKVYTLNPQQVKSMSAFFASADKIRMEIRPLESKLEGEGTIVVDFDQKVVAPSVGSPDKFIPLRATLSRQADDRWIITGIHGR
jgi:hypothetical protein